MRDRVALVTAYAAGLRVGEVSRLKPTSIDSKRMLILITGGKGGKDRYVMLSLAAAQHPARLLVPLQAASLAVSGTQS